MTTETSAPSLGLPPEPLAPRRGARAALKASFVGRTWRALRRARRDAALRLWPALARRRAALREEAGARLRALAEARPERALALIRRLAPRDVAAGGEAILTARTKGWAAAAPLFARLAPGAAGAALLRRGAPGPALDLAPPARERAPAIPADEAAGIVVYTTRFGPQARALPRIAAAEGVRFLCLGDGDAPAEGWETSRLAPPADVAPSLLEAFARIRPEEALAAAAPGARASLYVAPDMLLAGNLDTLVTRWLAAQDVAAWRHPRAVGWQDLAEGAALAAVGRERDAVIAQARDCEAADLPREAGAVDTRILWRRHGSPAAAALAAAWWEAHARAPGDLDLALARALLAPGAPAGPRILPAALGASEDGVYAAALPPRRRAADRAASRLPAGARPKVAVVYARGYEHYAATLLRAEQLAGLLAERLGERFDIRYTADTDDLRDHVVVLTKWAAARRKPAEIAAIRARNVAVVASWDDLIPEPATIAAVDAQMSLSIRQTIELNRRWPEAPTFFVTHHVNRRIRPAAPPADRLRAGYFGELFNTVRPASLAGAIELNGVATTGHSSAPTSWMDALDRYNCHWIVRRRHPFDGAKPLLKAFVAARCGATVIADRDDGDAAYYLGDDYPFYVGSLEPATLEADYLRVASAFGGPDWRRAQAIMRQVAARSSDEVVCAQFRAMVETLIA